MSSPLRSGTPRTPPVLRAPCRRRRGGVAEPDASRDWLRDSRAVRRRAAGSLIAPERLRSGDRVAAVTLSWGGPGHFRTATRRASGSWSRSSASRSWRCRTRRTRPSGSPTTQRRASRTCTVRSRTRRSRGSSRPSAARLDPPAPPPGPAADRGAPEGLHGLLRHDDHADGAAQSGPGLLLRSDDHGRLRRERRAPRLPRRGGAPDPVRAGARAGVAAEPRRVDRRAPRLVGPREPGPPAHPAPEHRVEVVRRHAGRGPGGRQLRRGPSTGCGGPSGGPT